MSASNGHVPEGAIVATLEMLQKANRAYRKLPRLSEHMGAEVGVWIRAIRNAVYSSFLPQPPKEAQEWPRDDEARAAVAQRWFDALPDEERAARRAVLTESACKVIAAGVVDPPMTVDPARDLGDDVDYLAAEILIFSGLLKPEPKEPKPEPNEEPAKA
jgi:hypothetical protein